MRKLTTLNWFAILVFAVFTGLNSVAYAQSEQLPERPETQQLLPETTVGLVKLRDFREFVEKFKGSSAGQMMQSDSVAPLVESLYQNAAKQYDNVQEKVGLSLEEIQSLPSGEITFAIIAPRRKDIAFVVMMETDKENEAVNKALERGRELYEQESEAEVESEKNEFDVEIETVSLSGQPAYFANHDGLLIGSSSKQELEDIFTRWSGGEVEKVRPLSKNRKFITISKRCAVSEEALPDARFYADPIGIFKSTARGNAPMQFGVALLPTLGLDGILAVGGNAYISIDDYESITHGHLLLASPKEGILNALALKPDDYTPEPWVPVELAQYMTTSWDVPQMMASIQEISDKIVDGKYEEFFENIQIELESKDVDLDIREDLIAHLSGRITVVRPILSGAELNGIGNAVSLGLADVELFDESLQKLMLGDDDFGKWWSEREYGGVKYWGGSEEAAKTREERINRRLERRRKRNKEQGRETETDPPKMDVRQSKPSFGIIGDQFVVSDSEEFFEMAIDTFNGDKIPLADDEDFQSHVDAMSKLLKTDLPAAVFYFDSVREIGFYMKAFGQDSVMEVMEGSAENDETGFIADVKASIDEHGLPAMEDIEQYLSASGGFITTDDSGYHFLFFQERPSQ